jgi:hypothetical protein
MGKVAVGGVAQGVGPEYTSTAKKKKREDFNFTHLDKQQPRRA